MASDAASGSQTLDRALAALVHIGECGARGLTLAECSANLGYSKPTAHRILRTLAARGFLRVDRERGLYSLGPANLRLGMAFLDQLDLRSEALPILRQLREQTGETVHLGVLDRHDVVYIEKVESEHAVRMFSRIGSTMPAYSTGVGKAILASLPPDELEQALPERLEARTPRTTSRTRTGSAVSARRCSTTPGTCAPGSAWRVRPPGWRPSASPSSGCSFRRPRRRSRGGSATAGPPTGQAQRGRDDPDAAAGRGGAGRRLQREVARAPASAVPAGRAVLGPVPPRRRRRPGRDRARPRRALPALPRRADVDRGARGRLDPRGRRAAEHRPQRRRPGVRRRLHRGLRGRGRPHRVLPRVHRPASGPGLAREEA